MPQQKNPAHEDLFAVIDGQDVPKLDTPELIASALNYLDKVLSSNATLRAGTRGHRRATRTYNAILNAVIHRLDDMANMRYATGHRTALRAFEYAVIVADRQDRTPWLRQLACIRHLAETDFSVLPDRFISIDAKFRPEQPLEPLVSEVIRLTKDDMPTDEDKATFDRLVALDEKSRTPRHPRPVQYVHPDPEPIETFHARKDRQIADFSKMLASFPEILGSDDSMVQRLREDDKDYAETIHAMRARATELAGTRRDDLPVADLLA